MAEIDYDQMPAGPEMDNLIADRIMGWKQTALDVFCYEFEPKRGVPIWTGRGENPGVASQGRGYLTFRPSEDIRDAWWIVKEIDGCLHLREHGEQGCWEALFCHYPESKSHGDTAPLAVCRAALKTAKEDME